LPKFATGAYFAAGLKNIKSPPDVMKESIEERVGQPAHDLERFDQLGTIASTARCWGCLHVGMIEIFGSQNCGGNNPATLAHAYRWPYNTAFGRLAVPSAVAYRHSRAQMGSLSIDPERRSNW
jgi:biopolymer transport protein ExbB